MFSSYNYMCNGVCSRFIYCITLHCITYWYNVIYSRAIYQFTTLYNGRMCSNVIRQCFPCEKLFLHEKCSLVIPIGTTSCRMRFCDSVPRYRHQHQIDRQIDIQIDSSSKIHEVLLKECQLSIYLVQILRNHNKQRLLIQTVSSSLVLYH